MKRPVSPQSCMPLCNPMDCRPSSSSVHGILQAWTLKCIVIPFSRGSSGPRDWIWICRITGRFFIIWATIKRQLCYKTSMELQCRKMVCMTVKAQRREKVMDAYKGKVFIYYRNSVVLIWTRLLEGFNTQGNHNKNIFKNHNKRNKGIKMVS